MSDGGDKYEVRANSGIVAGTITAIGEIKEVGSKGHRKCEIVVTTAGQYPQTIPVEFFGRNLEKLTDSGAGINDEVMVAVYLKGRTSGTRTYGSNDGWHIKIVRKGTPPVAPPPASDPYADLPF